MGKSVARVTKPETVPPLRDGDRLTREDFERRYDATPGVLKAELIQGVVHIEAVADGNGSAAAMPPVSNEGHAYPHFDLIGWLAVYRAMTPGVVGGDNPSIRFPSLGNMPQPDCVLRLLPEYGGRSSVDADGFLAGAPELVAEVASSSAAHDLGPKMRVYQTDGVREYLVWRTEYAAIEWFVLRRRQYAPIIPDTNGWLRSETFPGLWLDVAALLAGDMAKVLQVVQQGVASREHAAFVAKLQAAAGRRKRR